MHINSGAASGEYGKFSHETNHNPICQTLTLVLVSNIVQTNVFTSKILTSWIHNITECLSSFHKLLSGVYASCLVMGVGAAEQL